MAKKKGKKRNLQVSWCWYCDREFEDDKVLLQHQKAKHFRCPHCPRRLNTAGGLGVHIDQVHKLGVDKIENAIPGRDTFDVEIYGMEGIPPPDLADWKKRKASEGLIPAEQRQKRPKIDQSIISVEEFRKQVETHKALMSGQAPSVAAALAGIEGGSYPQPGLPGYGVPPSFPGLPLPPFPGPGGLPPPPGGLPVPPGFPLPPLPSFLPPPPGGFPIPPPGAMPPPPGTGGAPPTGFPQLPPFPPAPGVAVGTAQPAASGDTAKDWVAPSADIGGTPKLLKPGQLLLFSDDAFSPEEFLTAKFQKAAKGRPTAMDLL